MDSVFSLAGFLVGILVGITGVGGGALMTPILVLVFGVSPVLAVGTDLWFAALTKTVGGVLYHRNKHIDWQVFRRLCLGSIPTSLITLVWLQKNGIEKIEQGFILIALGAVLVLTAFAIMIQTRINKLGETVRAKMPAQFKRAQPALTVIAGSILGFLVTLTSIGAGALGVVMLVYLYPRRMTPASLVGTDIIHAIPLTVVAGAGHLWMGNVDMHLLGMLLLGSVPGIIIGSLIGGKAPAALLRTAIAMMLLLLGAKLVLFQ